MYAHKNYTMAKIKKQINIVLRNAEEDISLNLDADRRKWFVDMWHKQQSITIEFDDVTQGLNLSRYDSVRISNDS